MLRARRASCADGLRWRRDDGSPRSRHPGPAPRPARCPRLRSAGRYAAARWRSTVRSRRWLPAPTATRSPRGSTPRRTSPARFTLRSGVTSTSTSTSTASRPNRRCCRHRGAVAPLVPAGIDAPGRPRARRRAAGDDAVAGHRMPARFVRKEAKTYGTCQLAEGGDSTGAAVHRRRRRHVRRRGARRGGRAARAGAVLGTVVCVIDRESGWRRSARSGRPRAAVAVHDERACSRS